MPGGDGDAGLQLVRHHAWKAKREIRKLNTRADQAEAYAAHALDCAVTMIL